MNRDRGTGTETSAKWGRVNTRHRGPGRNRKNTTSRLSSSLRGDGLLFHLYRALTSFATRYPLNATRWKKRTTTRSVSRTFSNQRTDDDDDGEEEERMATRGREKQSARRRATKSRSGSLARSRETVLRWIVNSSTIIGSISNKAR